MERATLQKAKPFFKQFVQNRGKGEQKADSCNNSSNNAVYGALHADGTLIVPPYHVCFGSMRNYKVYSNQVKKGVGVDNPVVALFGQLQDTKPFIKDEAAYHYSEWLMNYSPWRHAFVTKSPKISDSKKAVIIDPTTPANLLAGAMIAFKQPWENYTPSNAVWRRISMWWELAQHTNPTIAFVVAQNLQLDHDIKDKSKLDKIKVMTGAQPTGHSPLRNSYDMDMINFIREVTQDVGNPWNQHYTYTGVWNVWSKYRHSGPAINPFIAKKLSLIGKGKENVNPFMKTAAVEYNLLDVIECMKEAIPEFEKLMEKAA